MFDGGQKLLTKISGPFGTKHLQEMRLVRGWQGLGYQ